MVRIQNSCNKHPVTNSCNKHPNPKHTILGSFETNPKPHSLDYKTTSKNTEKGIPQHTKGFVFHPKTHHPRPTQPAYAKDVPQQQHWTITNQSHKPADTKPTTHTWLQHHSSHITITVTPNQPSTAHDGTHRELTQKHAQIHRRIGPGNQSRHNTQPCSNGQSTNTHDSTVESKANKVTRSFFLCF